MTREEKIAELASYLPEQVHPPSRAAIEAWQKTEAYAEACYTNKVREAMNALCTREPTRVVVGEPDMSGWAPYMVRAYEKSKDRSFVLKSGHNRTMYVPDEAALDRELKEARSQRGES